MTFRYQKGIGACVNCASPCEKPNHQHEPLARERHHQTGDGTTHIYEVPQDALQDTEAQLSKSGAAMFIVAPHASYDLQDTTLCDAYAPLDGTHFAVDIGTAELAESLATTTGAALFCGHVGRLGIDLNRSLDNAYNADRPDGYPTVTEPAKRQALRTEYEKFHSGITDHVLQAVSGTQPVFLVDVHSFNRLWRDQKRVVDIGVCDHRLDGTAQSLMTHLRAEFGASHSVRMDEPYPGTHPGAFIGRHYHAMGAATVTIEICNDLIATAEGRAALLPGLTRALSNLRSEELSNVESV